MFVKKRNLIAYTHENEEAILLEKFLLLFLTAWLALDKECAEKNRLISCRKSSLDTLPPPTHNPRLKLGQASRL